jgi:hypothetical protein
MELWVGCVAGALEESEYKSLLTDAGFDDIDVEPTRIYSASDAAAFLDGTGLESDSISSEIDGRFASAFIRAVKPVESCCGSDCCT